MQTDPPQDQLNALANLYHSGQMAQVVSSCKELLQTHKRSLILYNILGSALQAIGRFEEAVKSYNQAIQIYPDYVDAHYNLGNVLKELGLLDEAVKSYNKAIQLKPDYVDAHYNLSVALKDLKQLEKSIQSCVKAIQLKPDYAEAYNNLGATLQELGRLDEAVKSYNKATKLKPDYADAYNNLGVTLQELGRLDEAVKRYNQAIKINPDYAEAYSNLGVVQRELGQLEEAINNYNKAIQLKPDYADAYSNLGNTLQDQGQLDEAVECYNQAIKLQPDLSMAYNNRNCALNYFSELTQTDVFQKHLEFEEQFGLKILKDKQTVRLNKSKNTRLRVGYISADFNSHSVGYFFEPLLKHHDHYIINTYCYYNNIKEDSTTKRLIDVSEHWRSIIRMNDKDIINLIRKDKINILIDLSGHTKGNRLTVFSHNPAPIQVTWLGYPNTTGLSSIDYRFTDEIADPISEADKFHSEELVRLPKGFLCYQGNESVSTNKALPCLKRGYITFGSFNNLTKITPQVIKIWSRILQAVPNSHLLLKSKQLSDSSTKSRYLELFKEEGISEDRLELHSWMPEKDGHLRLYGHVDIGLDPFPYNGTTTTCEALWMGTPVITILGDRHVSRVGASILTHVGLEEFIATDIDEYINMAIKYANNMDSIKSIRAGLRHNMKNSDLCNADAFARDVEKALDEMWNQYLQKS